MGQRQPLWFAICVRPRFERVVASNLERKGFEVVLPTHSPQSRKKKQRRSDVPSFPGYVFCKSTTAEIPSLLAVPGVLYLLGAGIDEYPTTQSEIKALKVAVDAGLQCRPCPFLESGRRVRISEGPLRGLEGIVPNGRNGLGNRHGNRIVIGISCLQRAVVVEMNEDSRVAPVFRERPNLVSTK